MLNVKRYDNIKAIESGVLEKADENAKNIIRNMIKANETTKNFEVEFEYK